MREAGIRCERFVIGRERLVVPLDGAEYIAHAEPRLGEIGLQRQRLLITNHRFVGPRQVEIQVAFVEVRFGVVRIDGQRLFDASGRRVILLQFGEGRAPLIERRKKAFAGLLDCFPVSLGDLLLQQHIKQRKFLL